MCEYCESEELNTIGLFKTTESGKYYSYDIYIYKDCMRIGEDSNKIHINYCPMCGRKLWLNNKD